MSKCDVCNTDRGMFSTWTTKDYHKVCSSCIRLVARGDEEFYQNLLQRCNEITLAEWQSFFENPSDAQKWNYSDSQIFTQINTNSGTIEFDDRDQTISIPHAMGLSERTYHYSEIYKYEYLDNHSIVSTGGSGVGRAIVGGMLFGGAGAIVGAVTKKHSYEDASSNMRIKITFIVNNEQIVEEIKITGMLDGKTRVDSWTYKGYIKTVERIISKLDEAYAMCHEEMNSQNNSNNDDKEGSSHKSIDIIQQMKQLKSLYEQDLITEEEYSEQKKRLLNNYDFSLNNNQSEANEQNNLDFGVSNNPKLEQNNTACDIHNNPMSEQNVLDLDEPDDPELVESTIEHKLYQIGDILFDISLRQPNMKDEDCQIWSDMCAFLRSRENTIQEYTKAINSIASKNKCIATSDYNSGLFYLALNRIQNSMYINEVPIFFADEGILFNKAKVGYFVTNFHLFFLKKNNIITFNLNELFSVSTSILGGGWTLNDSDAYLVNKLPFNNPELYALNMAFILQLHAELVGKNTHIIIKGY